MAEKNLAVILSIKIGLAFLAFKANQLTHYSTQSPLPVSVPVPRRFVKTSTSFRLNLINEFSV